MIPPGLEAAFLESWRYFLHLAFLLIPLFIGASLLVGLLREYLPPKKVEQQLRSHDEGTGNLVAAGFGALTPFCSCSTVPILAGLLQAGAPIGLAFSFLLASPLVNTIAVLLLLGLFGIEVTVWYIAVTFVAAVVGGIVIGRLDVEKYVNDVSISDDQVESEKSHRQHFKTAAREAWSFFVDTSPYLVLGMVLGALIHGVVPVDLLHTVLGSDNPLAVPLAALAGAPVYVSLSGMLPIAASLSEQGIAIGTVLAFVIGGAGVSIPNLILLNKLFKRRLLLIYAITVVTIGILVGVLFNTLII